MPVSTLPRQKLLWFFLLATGFSYLGLRLLPLVLGEDFILMSLAEVLVYSWGPALAAVVTQLLLYRGSMARYGWNRKRFSFRWIFIAMLLPVAVVASTVGVVFLLGNLAGIPGFGQVVLDFSQQLASTSPIFPDASRFGLAVADGPPPIPGTSTIFFTVLILGMLGGATLSLLFYVGEEVGFRGLIQTETRSLGFLGGSFVTGALWGLWQLPLIWELNASPGLSAFFWQALATLGFGIAVAFPLAYLSSKTRSIYASATFLGVLGNIGGLGRFFFLYDDPLFSGVSGLAGMFVFLAITYLILRYDRAFVEKYPEMRY